MSLLSVVLLVGARAEERDDLGPNQYLRSDTEINVEIVDPAVDRIFWNAQLVDPNDSSVDDVDMVVTDPNGLQTTVGARSIYQPPIAGRYKVNPDDIDLDGDGILEPLTEWGPYPPT